MCQANFGRGTTDLHVPAYHCLCKHHDTRPLFEKGIGFITISIVLASNLHRTIDRYQIKAVSFVSTLFHITSLHPRTRTVANHASLNRSHCCHCQSDRGSPMYGGLTVDVFSISFKQQPYVLLSILFVTGPWPLILYGEDTTQQNQPYRQLSTRGRYRISSRVEIALEYGYIASHQSETTSGEAF